MSKIEAKPEPIVDAYVTAWNEREFGRLPDLVSESVVAHNPTAPGGALHGREDLEAFMRGILSGFPDFRVTVHEMLSSDDVVMYEATLSMTHEGEFQGIAPTGRTAEVREMASYRVDDGRIQEYRTCFDRQETFEQLGLADG
ncbi:ester cyclase [Halorarum halobium]|uniref:ester cyclase n=1 Tax=Halorarum halobium TaxID=3075121 RepID=UPI0028A7168C|nr:ester cyclase [Halobaculum sp. XH14]